MMMQGNSVWNYSSAEAHVFFSSHCQRLLNSRLEADFVPPKLLIRSEFPALLVGAVLSSAVAYLVSTAEGR